MKVDSALSLDGVVVSARRAGKMDISKSLAPMPDPRWVIVLQGVTDTTSVEIEAQGMRGNTAIVDSRAMALVGPRQEVTVQLRLDAACAAPVGPTCAGSETCAAGTCAALPTFAAGSRDAAAPDGPGPDVPAGTGGGAGGGGGGGRGGSPAGGAFGGGTAGGDAGGQGTGDGGTGLAGTGGPATGGVGGSGVGGLAATGGDTAGRTGTGGNGTGGAGAAGSDTGGRVGSGGSGTGGRGIGGAATGGSGTGGARAPNGNSCTTGSECASTYCVDKVCCNSLCDGTCSSCVATATGQTTGTCAFVSAGTDPGSECSVATTNVCAFDGFCDGAGACRRAMSGTACGGTSCTGRTATTSGMCDGTGTCVQPAAQSCDNLLTCASATACRTTCTSDSECVTDSQCMRGSCTVSWAPWQMPHPPSTGITPPFNYMVATDTVLDRVTNLTWQRYAAAGTFTIPAAITYCDALILGGFSDWRLPSRIELVSLVDYTRSTPAIDITAFPSTPAEGFWTSSPTAPPDNTNWIVEFLGGGASYNAMGAAPQRVRCVR